MQNTQFRTPESMELAEHKDVADIMRIISLCIRDMKARGINQWDDHYPDIQAVKQDAQSHSLFVMRHNGSCVVSVSLDDIQPEEYGSVTWRYVTGQALVVHRLCVHPHWQHRGFGSRVRDFAESFASIHGFSCIKLDAYTGNPRALALYERLGYQRAGQVFFPRRELPFACFEKEVSNNAGTAAIPLMLGFREIYPQ